MWQTAQHLTSVKTSLISYRHDTTSLQLSLTLHERHLQPHLGYQLNPLFPHSYKITGISVSESINAFTFTGLHHLHHRSLHQCIAATLSSILDYLLFPKYFSGFLYTPHFISDFTSVSWFFCSSTSWKYQPLNSIHSCALLFPTIICCCY